MSSQYVKWRGCLALCAAALALFLISSGRTDATSIRIPLSELNGRSRLVVQGRVERIESQWTAGGEIESIVTVRLVDVPRGALSVGSTIPVRVRGGTVDGLTMGTSEEPVFQSGEDVVVFLAGPERGAYRVAEGSQGKYVVTGDRATNSRWNRSLSLQEMRDGATGGRWPAEPVLSEGAEAAAASPESYSYNNAKWFGPNPMEENYLINVNTADANGANGTADAFRAAIRNGAGAWNNAGAAFSFKYGGTTTAVPARDTGDGLNVLAWEDMGGTTTLAEATWWSYEKGDVDQIVEVDIRFNDYYNWDATGSPASNELDLQSVATHELGHWLSLAHDTQSSCSSVVRPHHVRVL